jgi:archaellum component FlaC
MSALDVKVDTSVLGDVKDALNKVKNGLDATKNTTDKASNEVYHSRLAGEIRSFHTKWDGRRGKALETVEEIKKATATIKETLESWDKELASGLEQSD